MLVLTRKANQSIMIGDDIEVSVLSVIGEKVRLGIQAPRHVLVFRKEVFLEIQAQNLQAQESAPRRVDEALGMMNEADSCRCVGASLGAAGTLRGPPSAWAPR